MIDESFAKHFAAEWIDAWNKHDLELILAHYEDDFEMSSPLVPKVVDEPSGTLRGKAAIGDYWSKALQLYPNLHFELITTLAGVDSITLYYQNHQNRQVAEVFIFGSNQKVVKAFANYSV